MNLVSGILSPLPGGGGGVADGDCGTCGDVEDDDGGGDGETCGDVDY